MTTFRQLSRPLRVVICAPWMFIVCAIALAATPGARQLLLDASGNAAVPGQLSANSIFTAGAFQSGNIYDTGSGTVGITGPINAQGLTMNGLPILDQYGNLTVPGTSGFDNGTIYTDGSGDLVAYTFIALNALVSNALYANGGDPSITFDATTGHLVDDGSDIATWTYDGVHLNQSLFGSQGETLVDAGNNDAIYTPGGITAQGAASFDYAAFTTDGVGDVQATSVSVASGFYGDGSNVTGYSAAFSAGHADAAGALDVGTDLSGTANYNADTYDLVMANAFSGTADYATNAGYADGAGSADYAYSLFSEGNGSDISNTTMIDLPTSPGATGALWNNAGVVNVSP